MPSALEWYVLIVVMTFVSLFAVAHYAQWTANGALDRKWNTPVGWIIVAATVGVFTVGVLGVYGSTVPDPDRGEIGAYLFNMGPLVAGCIGLAVAAGHGRLVVLFRRAEQTRTAAVGSADAGTTVIVTGEVEALTQATSPALDQSGVCWSWAFDIRGTGEQRFDDPAADTEDLDWIPRKSGSGGVPFDFDDGSGPVRTDPEAVTVTLPMTDQRICHADGPQPGEVGQNLHRSVGGEQYRYREAVVTDGDRLTIVGSVTDDGTLDATRTYRPRTAETAVRTYTIRGLLSAGGGLLAIYVGLQLTAGYFGAPLPF